MLPGPDEVQDVYLNPETGILAGAIRTQHNKILMECGTIDTDVIIAVGKEVDDARVGRFVDAPVSGGPAGAKDGTLTFMVGCKEEAFPLVKPVLSHMGKADHIYLCGDVGSGSAFKVLNNYLSAIISVASAETLNMGVKMGLDPKKLTEVIQASGGQNWIMEHCNPCPGVKPKVASSRKYEGGFRVELCTKVFKMGIKLAEMVGAKLVLSTAAKESFEAVCEDDRFKGKDARVIYKWLANESID